MIFSLAKDKSPSPEGFSISFYQKIWDTIKAHILLLFSNLYIQKIDIYFLTQLQPHCLYTKKDQQPRGDRLLTNHH